MTKPQSMFNSLGRPCPCQSSEGNRVESGAPWTLKRPLKMAVAQKNGTQNETLVSGNIYQNLRNPSCLILSHSQMCVCPKTMVSTPFLRLLIEGPGKKDESYSPGVSDGRPTPREFWTEIVGSLWTLSILIPWVGGYCG